MAGGVANEHYAEYGIERLSLSRQSVQSLIGPIRMSRLLALLKEDGGVSHTTFASTGACSSYVEYLRSLSFSLTAIADMLIVSRMTVYQRRVEFGLLVEAQSSITDQELIRIVRHLSVQHPQVGQSFICGRLVKFQDGFHESIYSNKRMCSPSNSHV